MLWSRVPNFLHKGNFLGMDPLILFHERLKKIICEQTIAIDALKNVINRQKRLGMVHTLLDNNNNNKRMSIRKTLAYSGCIKNM